MRIAFRQFVSHTNQALVISPGLAIIIELLSTLQILHLIFEAMANLATTNEFIVWTFFKNIRFFTAGFHLNEYPDLESIISTIWYICAAYLILHLALIISLFLLSLRAKKLERLYSYLFGLLCLAHSRVFFFPIQFFLLVLIQLYNSSTCASSDSFYCELGWTFGTICLCVLNQILAIWKEFVLYQIGKTKDFFSSKTNLYYKFGLLYKSVLLIILLVSDQANLSKAGSVLHLFFNCLLMYILYTKLPFFRFKLLKIAIVMTTINICFSILSIIHSFTTNREVLSGLQIGIFVLPIFGAKIALTLFKDRFTKIVQSKTLTPDEAVHFHVLLKELTKKEDVSLLNDKSFFPDINVFSGILLSRKIDFVKLRIPTEWKSDKKKLYESIIDRMEQTLKKNTRSQLIMLSLAKIYYKKFHIIGKTLELLKKIRTQKPQVQILSGVDSLQKLLKKNDEEERIVNSKKFNADSFFKYKEATNSLKNMIKEEIQAHLDFWKKFKEHTIDVKDATNKASSIDRIHNNITRQFNKYYPEFQTNFQFPILLFAVYMNNVRYLPHEANQIMTKFQTIVSTNFVKNEFNIDSETTTIAVISLDTKKAGIILDVTESIQNIFRIAKKEVIGFNFGCFFPNVIAKFFQQEVNKYARNPTTKLDNKYKTIGKTSTGELFELGVHIQLQSNIDEEPKAIVKLWVISKPKPLLLINMDGTITDYAKELEEVFHREKMNLRAFKTLEEISTEFEKVNQAFNTYYGKPEKAQNPSDNTIGFHTITLDKIEETPHGKTNHTVDTHTEFPNLLSVSRDDDILLNSAKSQQLKTHHNISMSSPTKILTSLGGIGGFSNLAKRAFLKNDMPAERAKQICHVFTKGRRMVLRSRNTTPYQKGYRLKGDVYIKAYVLDGEVLKLVCLKNIKMDEPNDFEESSSDSDLDRSMDKFAEEFPMDEERATHKPQYLQQKVALTSLASSKYIIPSLVVNGKSQSKIDKSEKISKKYTNKSLSMDSPKESMMHEEEESAKMEVKNKIMIDDNRSSVMDYTYKENRFIKTLKEVSTRTRLLPMLKFATLVLYIVLLFIISLTTANFLLSRKSINDVERGVEIVDYSTKSLVNAEKAWGWTLFLFSQAVGVGQFTPELLTLLHYRVVESTGVFLNSTRNLKASLSQLDAKSFLEDAFAKDIAMYYPLGITMRRDDFDFFFATNFLVNKFISMMSYTNLLQLAMRDDILFNFNNTANDYMLKSQKLINSTDVFLQDIISSNLSTLRIVLVAQSMALLILAITLICMSLIILKAYDRFFNALIRLREESVENQIAQLEKVNYYYHNEEIEFKTFIQASYDIFDESRPHVRAKAQLRTAAKAKFIKTFSLERLRVKFVILTVLSLSFIPVLIGLFAGSLVGSMNAFRSFEEAKNQMNVLSQAMYQANMIVNSFAYRILFASRPTMLINNIEPSVLMYRNLAEFSKLNSLLNTVFLRLDNLDPIMQDILESTMCPYLGEEAEPTCLVATKNGLHGLMSVNENFVQSANQYFAAFERDPSLANAKVVALGFIGAASAPTTTLNYAYPYLGNLVMEDFHQEVDRTKENEMKYFLGVCGTIFLYIIFIHWVLIRRLRGADLSRRKILRIIPFNMVQENKFLSYYIKNDFGSEVQAIKSIL